MAIQTRRRWLAGSALLGPLATYAQPTSWAYQQFNPTIVKALLSHIVGAVNALAKSPSPDPRPIAATHAVTQLVFAHFEETGLSTLLDRHLTQFVPHRHPQATQLSAAVRDYGMRVAEDLFPRMVTPDADTAQARKIGWSGLRPLLLHGLEVGMTTLAAPQKTYKQVTWEPPWPLIVRAPLKLKNPQLAAELPRVQAAGKVAIHLGVAVNGLAGAQAMEAEAVTDPVQMSSIGGTAAISIGVAVFLICFHAQKRLAAS